MRLIRMLLLAALASVPAFSHADDEAAIKRLTGLLDRAQTLSGRFSQLTLDGSGTQLQETSGQLALQRPGLFRWHTDEPMEQVLYDFVKGREKAKPRARRSRSSPR